MAPTYADFGTEPPRLGNVEITGTHRSSAADDHLAINAGGSVEFAFDVPDPAVVREACVTLVALVSMLAGGPGYAPLTVHLNGRPLADEVRIPNGGGLPQRRGNNGTIAFGGGGFLGTYRRVGEGPIGYRGRFA